MLGTKVLSFSLSRTSWLLLVTRREARGNSRKGRRRTWHLRCDASSSRSGKKKKKRHEKRVTTHSSGTVFHLRCAKKKKARRQDERAVGRGDERRTLRGRCRRWSSGKRWGSCSPVCSPWRQVMRGAGGQLNSQWGELPRVGCGGGSSRRRRFPFPFNEGRWRARAYTIACIIRRVWLHAWFWFD